jgi:hypothetical protein
VVAVCAPVSGKFVALWLNVPGTQAVVEWQAEQIVPMPDEPCGGRVVAVYAA